MYSQFKMHGHKSIKPSEIFVPVYQITLRHILSEHYPNHLRQNHPLSIKMIYEYNRTPLIRIGLALPVNDFLLKPYYVFLWLESPPPIVKYI